MKKDMMPIDAVTWSVGIFFIIVMLVAAQHILKPKVKVIKPSGPGACSVACCIEVFKKHCKVGFVNFKLFTSCNLNLNSDLDKDIKDSRAATTKRPDKSGNYIGRVNSATTVKGKK